MKILSNLPRVQQALVLLIMSTGYDIMYLKTLWAFKPYIFLATRVDQCEREETFTSMKVGYMVALKLDFEVGNDTNTTTFRFISLLIDLLVYTFWDPNTSVFTTAFILPFIVCCVLCKNRVHPQLQTHWLQGRNGGSFYGSNDASSGQAFLVFEDSGNDSAKSSLESDKPFLPPEVILLILEYAVSAPQELHFGMSDDDGPFRATKLNDNLAPLCINREFRRRLLNPIKSKLHDNNTINFGILCHDDGMNKAKILRDGMQKGAKVLLQSWYRHITPEPGHLQHCFYRNQISLFTSGCQSGKRGARKTTKFSSSRALCRIMRCIYQTHAINSSSSSLPWNCKPRETRC